MTRAAMRAISGYQATTPTSCTAQQGCKYRAAFAHCQRRSGILVQSATLLLDSRSPYLSIYRRSRRALAVVVPFRSAWTPTAQFCARMVVVDPQDGNVSCNREGP